MSVSLSTSRRRVRTCCPAHNCGGRCLLVAHVEDGVIVTRTDSLGAGLTQKIPVSVTPGDLGNQYCDFLDAEAVHDRTDPLMPFCIVRKVVRCVWIYRVNGQSGFPRCVLYAMMV